MSNRTTDGTESGSSRNSLSTSTSRRKTPRKTATGAARAVRTTDESCGRMGRKLGSHSPQLAETESANRIPSPWRSVLQENHLLNSPGWGLPGLKKWRKIRNECHVQQTKPSFTRSGPNQCMCLVFHSHTPATKQWSLTQGTATLGGKMLPQGDVQD